MKLPVLSLVVLAVLFTVPALAKDKVTGTGPHACRFQMKQGQFYQGRLLRADGPLPYVLRCDNGVVFPLVSSPALDALKTAPGPKGLAVEAWGVVQPVDGKPALRVNELHVVTTVAGRKYPFRGRCKHCGCRMEVDSASEATGMCDECKCHKSKGDCVHY